MADERWERKPSARPRGAEPRALTGVKWVRRGLFCTLLAALLIGATAAAAVSPARSLGRGSRSARYTYVVNALSNDVSQFSVGPGGALATKANPITGGANPFAIGISPDGKSAYVVNSNVPGRPSTVSQYTIDPSGALVTKANPIASGTHSRGIAISPGGKSAYVVNYDDNTVSQFMVGPGGVLARKGSPIASGPHPRGIAVAPDGGSVYVVNGGPEERSIGEALPGDSDTVSQYTIGRGGVLARKGSPIASGKGPVGIAVSPDGKSAYVVNGDANTVSQYTIGQGGVLATKAKPIPSGNGPAGSVACAACRGAPDAIAVSPDGKSAYVLNFRDNTVSQYTIGRGGVLATKASPIATGTNPYGIAVSPDGRSVYVTNFGDNTVSQYTIGQGGVLATKGNPIATGTSPVGIAITP